MWCYTAKDDVVRGSNKNASSVLFQDIEADTCPVRLITTSLTPSLPHPLTPSPPHPLTPSPPYSLTPSLPHPLTPSPPHSLTPSLPHPLTPSSLPHAHIQYQVGYRRSVWRCVLLYPLAALPAGLGLLAAYWFPAMWLKLTAYRCSLASATHVIVKVCSHWHCGGEEVNHVPH